MKEKWEINGVFILFGIIILCSFFLKSTQVEIPVTSTSDTEIVFSTNDEYLMQTWTPNVKNINSITIPLTAVNTFEATLEVSIWTDDYTYKLDEAQIEYNFEESVREQIQIKFDKPIKVEIGKRHYIQISFVQSSSYGEIKVPINSKYTGCSVEDKIQGAAQLTIGSEKNSRFYWLLITYMPFVLVSVFLSVVFNRKIEETLGASFGLIVLWIFLFGLIRKMELGVKLLVPICILIFALIIYICNRRKIKIFKLFTPGVFLYGVGMLFIMVACQDYYRKGHDEYIHWGLAVKDMFIFNSFANHGESGMFVKRYPPFTTILEYYFTYTNKMFAESILFVAYISMLFALLLIIFKSITWKRKRYLIPGIILALLIPMVFYENIYTLYVDLFLMVLVTYVLVCYFEEGFTSFNIIRLVIGLSALVLTKDMGLVLAGMIVAMIFIDIIMGYYRKDYGIDKRIIWSMIIITLSVIIPFVMWQIYLKIPVEIVSDMQVQTTDNSIQASGIGLRRVWELLVFRAPEYKYQVIKTFLKGILYKVKFPLGNVAFSYIAILVINVLLTFQYRKNKKNNYIYRSSLLTIILAIGYAFALLMTYLFAFSPKEALEITSAERYLGSCIGGIVLAIWMLILGNAVEEGDEEKAKEKIFIFSVVLVLCAPIDQINPNNVVSYVTEQTLTGYDEIGEAFRTFCDKDDRVYYVSHYTKPLESLIYTNYAYPIQGMDLGKIYIYSTDKYYEKEKKNVVGEHLEERCIIVTAEQWEDELQEYDYVYLHKPAGVFKESYGSFFEDVNTIENGACYKVDKSKHKIQLKYVGIMN